MFWDITSCSLSKVNRCFGGNIASIFKVEEWAKQETSVKQVANWKRAYQVNVLEPILFPFYFETGIGSVHSSLQVMTNSPRAYVWKESFKLYNLRSRLPAFSLSDYVTRVQRLLTLPLASGYRHVERLQLCGLHNKVYNFSFAHIRAAVWTAILISLLFYFFFDFKLTIFWELFFKIV
jgi:hypothetical protein